MKRPPCSFLAISLFLSVGLIPTFAGSAGNQVIEVPPASQLSPWTFDATMYGWLTGLDGDIGIGGFDVGFDESFLDIIDDVNFVATLRLEARNGRWGAIVDGFYVDLGVSGNPPGPLYDNAGVEMSQFMGELAVAYRVYESPSGFVDLYGGVRYNSLTNDLAGTLSQSGIQSTSAATGAGVVNAMEARAEAIAQPVAASYQAAAVAERAVIEAELTAAIKAEADAKVKQDIERKLIEINRDNGRDGRVLEVERFNTSVKAVRSELGYRYLHTDYSEGSFDYDVAQAGIYTGFNFRF